MPSGEKARLKEGQRRALQAILAHARSIVPVVDGSASGPMHSAKWFSSFLLKTRTDNERDRLAGDPAVLLQFREILVAEGYPTSAVSAATFAFESQETIDREWSRNWRHTME